MLSANSVLFFHSTHAFQGAHDPFRFFIGFGVVPSVKPVCCRTGVSLCVFTCACGRVGIVVSTLDPYIRIIAGASHSKRATGPWYR